MLPGDMLRFTILALLLLPGCSPTGSCVDETVCSVNITEATCGKLGKFVAEDGSAAIRRCQSLGFTEPVDSTEKMEKTLKAGELTIFKRPAGQQPRSAEVKAAEASEQEKIKAMMNNGGPAPSP